VPAGDSNRLIDGASGAPDVTAPQIGLPKTTPVNAYLQWAWHARNFRAIADGATEIRGPGALRTLLDAGAAVTVRALTQR
jgi:hypothetical protein